MIKKLLAFYGISAMVIAALLVAGTPSKAAPSRERGYSLPKDAVQISDNLYSLGTTRDPKTGKLVEGYAIIHRKDAQAKPSGAGAGSKGPTCYGFLAKGAKWKGTPEPWVVNPENNSGLTDSFIFNSIATDIGTWETAAVNNVLGDGSTTNDDLSVGVNKMNDVNETYFGTIADSNTIAVTIVWGYFYGPTFSRELLEWDQIYNTYYQWSDAGEAGKMDFRNINTHELGHSFGLGDLYNSACSLETMYGYADFGETNKQDLNTGDITGINQLY